MGDIDPLMKTPNLVNTGELHDQDRRRCNEVS